MKCYQCSMNIFRSGTMPILENLSRRLHMLTTDAKPDPPRIHIEDNTNNLGPRLSQKSAPQTPEVDTSNEGKSEGRDRRSSMPERSAEDKERRNSAETKKPRFKTKSTKNGKNYNSST